MRLNIGSSYAIVVVQKEQPPKVLYPAEAVISAFSSTYLTYDLASRLRVKITNFFECRLLQVLSVFDEVTLERVRFFGQIRSRGALYVFKKQEM